MSTRKLRHLIHNIIHSVFIYIIILLSLRHHFRLITGKHNKKTYQHLAYRFSSCHNRFFLSLLLQRYKTKNLLSRGYEKLTQFENTII